MWLFYSWKNWVTKSYITAQYHTHAVEVGIKPKLLTTPWQDPSKNTLLSYFPCAYLEFDLPLQKGPTPYSLYEQWTMCIFTKLLNLPCSSTIPLFLTAWAYYRLYSTVKEGRKVASRSLVPSSSLANLADWLCSNTECPFCTCKEFSLKSLSGLKKKKTRYWKR